MVNNSLYSYDTFMDITSSLAYLYEEYGTDQDFCDHLTNVWFWVSKVAEDKGVELPDYQG